MKFEKLLTEEETRSVQLGILRSFDEFCTAHGLRYFLAYGTLIGAVRHKGYIPWDDDIDIQMPRPDYNRLREIFDSEKPNEHLRLIFPTDPEAQHTFAKITDERTVKIEAAHRYKTERDLRGIDIDIFPLDGVPEDGEEHKRWYKKLRRIYRKLWISDLEPEGELKTSFKAAIYLFKFIRIFYPKKEKLLGEAAALHALYPYEDSKLVGVCECYFDPPSDRHEKTAYESSLQMDFEGKSFRCPVGTHEVLTNLFGDYMTPPPEGARVTHHTNKNYWRDPV